MGFDSDPQLAARLAALQHPELKIISPGLERMQALLAALGNPHLRLPPVIHLAGTNGKGSTQAMLRAMLEAAGRRVHAYTSPHLVSFCERITLAGRPITKAELLPLIDQVQALQSTAPATFFEATTAVAFLAFAQAQADVLLLETGLGGRLDATNVIEKPMATIITPIGFDHQEFLGDTLEQIAAEKAGILRAGVPAIIAMQPPQALRSIETTCPKAMFLRGGQEWNYRKLNDTQWQFEGQGEQFILPVPVLAGEHQIANAALAVATLRQTHPQMTPVQMATGLQQAQWPARIQPITSGYWRQFVGADTPLFLDGAHNPMGAAALAQWVKTQFPTQKPILIMGMKADKDLPGFLQHWQGLAQRIYAVSIPDEPACVAPETIAKTAQDYDIKSEISSGVEAALGDAARHHCPIILCGSLYLAGAILAKN